MERKKGRTINYLYSYYLQYGISPKQYMTSVYTLESWNHSKRVYPLHGENMIADLVLVTMPRALGPNSWLVSKIFTFSSWKLGRLFFTLFGIWRSEHGLLLDCVFVIIASSLDISCPIFSLLKSPIYQKQPIATMKGVEDNDFVSYLMDPLFQSLVTIPHNALKCYANVVNMHILFVFFSPKLKSLT